MGSAEKQEPVISVDKGGKNAAKITASSQFVSAVWAKDQHGQVVHFEKLTNTGSPHLQSTEFAAGENGITHLTPYEFSNHGVWEGATTIITAVHGAGANRGDEL
jgi:hypothetical protein